MQEINATFYSDGLKLDGSVYLPDGGAQAGKPVVVVCSGFTGLNAIHPARYSRYLTRKGYPCFGFDYRGFGKSEGEEGHVIIDEQVRDIANAVRYVRDHAKTAGRPVVLAGWGMGAGLVLEAAKLARVDGLVCMNGLYNAKNVQKQVRGEDGWVAYRKWLDQERSERIKDGKRKNVDPFDIYPLDQQSRTYVDNVLRKTPGYGLTADIRFADSLLNMNAYADLEGFEDVPLWIGHGRENRLHPVEEPRALYAKYPGPKELYLLPGGGHTEWMLDDDPKFQTFAGKLHAWLERQEFTADESQAEAVRETA